MGDTKSTQDTISINELIKIMKILHNFTIVNILYPHLFYFFLTYKSTVTKKWSIDEHVMVEN